jgi:hypothetical protein
VQETGGVRVVANPDHVPRHGPQGIQEEWTMTNQVDAKLMCLVAALRHGIQTLNTPGLSVNVHPNPFFLHVIGELDLKHIAERVIKNLEEFTQSEAKRHLIAAAEQAKAQEGGADRVATAASAVDGH